MLLPSQECLEEYIRKVIVLSKDLGSLVLEKLREMHGEINLEEFTVSRVRKGSLYEFIVGAVLSQNTSDKNALKAYESLRSALGGAVEPQHVLSCGAKGLANAVKPAGMNNVRAKVLFELAKLFSEKGFEERLKQSLREANSNEAHRVLLEMPGIGPKTADVILLMYFGKNVFPVDTHIARVTERLGLASGRSYYDVRRTWMEILKPAEYLEAHLLLITHGRRICRSRKPLCINCSLKPWCKYFNEKGRKLGREADPPT